MKHVFQQLQRSTPLQRHKLVLDLHSQTPAPLKLALNRVSHNHAVSHRSLLQCLTTIACSIAQVLKCCLQVLVPTVIHPRASADAYCFVQVLVGELMTNADMRADAVISPAVQNVLLMLSASEAQGLVAGADLLQHLVPSHKHLTMLHRHVQVCNLSVSLLWMMHHLRTICIT